MEIRILILDNDTAYLEDVKEYLDSLGKYTTNTDTLDMLTKKDYEGFDLVIANERISSLVSSQNVVPMFPEYSVGKGFAKYSGKTGLVKCIEENCYSIKSIENKPNIITFSLLGNFDRGVSFLLKLQKEIEEQDRKILVINLSFSFQMLLKSNISSSDLIFYLFSEIEEKNDFISNVLRSDKNYLYLKNVNSLQEIFEIEKSRIPELMQGIKDIDKYEYVFLLLEPGLRESIYLYGEGSDLNIFMIDKDRKIVKELLKTVSEKFKISLVDLNKTVINEKIEDKRVLDTFLMQKNFGYLRRIDSIFGRAHKQDRKGI